MTDRQPKDDWQAQIQQIIESLPPKDGFKGFFAHVPYGWTVPEQDFSDCIVALKSISPTEVHHIFVPTDCALGNILLAFPCRRCGNNNLHFFEVAKVVRKKAFKGPGVLFICEKCGWQSEIIAESDITEENWFVWKSMRGEKTDE